MFELSLNDPDGYVMLKCNECGNYMYTNHDLYDYEDGNKCVVIKDSTTITCEHCSKTQSASDGKTIIQETREPAPTRHLPECPACHSLSIEKIGAVKKYSSFAVMGVFSPNLGKQFHCKSCDYRF